MKIMCSHSWKTCGMCGYEYQWKVEHRAKTVTKCVGINVRAPHVREAGDVDNEGGHSQNIQFIIIVMVVVAVVIEYWSIKCANVHNQT